MSVLRNGFLLVMLLFMLIGCSSNGSEDATIEEAEKELEELEEELGVTEGDEGGIPDLLPSDLYLAEDMEVDHTVENELMSQVAYRTNQSYDELKESYNDYLNKNSDFSDIRESASEDPDTDFYFIAYYADYEGNELEIAIRDDEATEGSRFVSVTLYDNEAVDEAIEEMEKQMEED